MYRVVVLDIVIFTTLFSNYELLNLERHAELTKVSVSVLIGYMNCRSVTLGLRGQTAFSLISVLSVSLIAVMGLVKLGLGM